MDDTTPKRRLPLGLLAAAALLAVVASLARRESAPRAAPVTRAPSTSVASGEATVRPAPRDDPRVTPETSARGEATAPGLPRHMQAHAREAVDRYIDQAGLADSVGETERIALVTALGQVRASSRWMQRHARGHRSVEAQNRDALIEADRAFRETLGVGVGEFIAALNPPGTIEDLGAARQ